MTKEKLYMEALLIERDNCADALKKLSDAEDKIKELNKLIEHGNGDILLGWMDAHRKAMDRLKQAEKEASEAKEALREENQNWIDEFNRLEDINKSLLRRYLKCKKIIVDLLDSAEYWSEYDVPLGIVDRMKEAVE